jgi:TrpR family trp operon transcriptional repressor
MHVYRGKLAIIALSAVSGKIVFIHRRRDVYYASMHRNSLPRHVPSDALALGDIIDVFAGIRDHGIMRRFFNEIFTPVERHNLSMRWQLLKLLHQRVPQRTIAARLGVSLCKITRGARVLKNNRSISRSILDMCQASI